jgi:hypothetical protein
MSDREKMEPLGTRYVRRIPLLTCAVLRVNCIVNPIQSIFCTMDSSLNVFTDRWNTRLKFNGRCLYYYDVPRHLLSDTAVSVHASPQYSLELARSGRSITYIYIYYKILI